MKYTKTNHYDFMKLAIAKPNRSASRISVYKNISTVCLCEEKIIPIVTLGAFSDGFSDGFEI